MGFSPARAGASAVNVAIVSRARRIAFMVDHPFYIPEAAQHPVDASRATGYPFIMRKTTGNAARKGASMVVRKLAILIISVVAAATLSIAGAADGPDELAQARALEKQMEKIIAEAEPSIVCILVSRNEKFRKALPSQKTEGTRSRLPGESYRQSGMLGHPHQNGPDKDLQKAFDSLADPAHV